MGNNREINTNYNYNLEFQQLKAYYNFRIDFKKKLKEKKSTNKYDNTEYYLIDRKWLQNWKMHVGYNNFSVERKNYKLDEKKLDNNDYNNILNYLKIFSNQNTIFPLDNNNIFINGEVNPISDFVVVDKDCYDSFTCGNDQLNKENKTFYIMFFKDKFLLKFSVKQFLLSFKIEEKNINKIVKEHSWELVLTLKEKVDEKTLINFFTNSDNNIVYWLKNNNFYINSTEKKDIYLNNDTIFIFNKTLLINKKRNLFDTIHPQMNNGIMQIIKINNKPEMKNKHNTFFIDDKSNENLLNIEKNKNIQLNNRIKQLEIDLKNEKEKNKNLNEQVEKYKSIIIYLNDKLFGNNLVDNNKVLELQNIIKEKIDEINVLKSKLNNGSLNNIQPGEQIIAIGFISTDLNIQNFFRPCKDSDLFVKLEEKLYDEYPEYKDVETYFLVNGRKVLRFKSMKENNIKNGQVIMLNIVDELNKKK